MRSGRISVKSRPGIEDPDIGLWSAHGRAPRTASRRAAAAAFSIRGKLFLASHPFVLFSPAIMSTYGAFSSVGVLDTGLSIGPLIAGWPVAVAAFDGFALPRACGGAVPL